MERPTDRDVEGGDEEGEAGGRPVGGWQDGRCSPAVLDFPPVEENCDSEEEAEEAEMGDGEEQAE